MTCRRLLPLAVLPVLGLAACGSSSSSSPPPKPKPASAPTGATLHLAADPKGALRFDTTKLSARAGRVTLVMRNTSGVAHAVAVEGHGVDRDGPTTSNGTSSVSAPLKPGTYTFYCPVDGHEDAGMKGTLTVR